MQVLRVVVITLVGFLVVVAALAQDPGSSSNGTSKAPAASGQTATPAETDPLKRPLTDAQKKANAKAFQKEISKTYKKWLDEDVRWIITD